MPVKIGEMLSKEGLITPQQLQEALAHQKQNGIKLGRALVSLGFVKDDEITGLNIAARPSSTTSSSPT